jgi:hypothetical protein
MKGKLTEKTEDTNDFADSRQRLPESGMEGRCYGLNI